MGSRHCHSNFRASDLERLCNAVEPRMSGAMNFFTRSLLIGGRLTMPCILADYTYTLQCEGPHVASVTCVV
jgi:hypothetical protein